MIDPDFRDMKGEQKLKAMFGFVVLIAILFFAFLIGLFWWIVLTSVLS